MTKAKKDLKKLTPAELKKQVKKLDAVEEFVVTIDGEDYKLTHDTVFRITKQQKVLEDMMKYFSEINEDNMEMLDYASSYTVLLIIKHFTSLDVPDEIEDAMALLEVLVDLGVLANIVNTLPEEEVVKVYNLLNETLENMDESLKQIEEEAQAMVDEMQNKELAKFKQDEEEATEDNGEVQ